VHFFDEFCIQYAKRPRFLAPGAVFQFAVYVDSSSPPLALIDPARIMFEFVTSARAGVQSTHWIPASTGMNNQSAFGPEQWHPACQELEQRAHQPEATDGPATLGPSTVTKGMLIPMRSAPRKNAGE